jgi:hypothetical protein
MIVDYFNVIRTVERHKRRKGQMFVDRKSQDHSAEICPSVDVLFFERAVLPSGSRCHRIVARSIWCSAIASCASHLVGLAIESCIPFASRKVEEAKSMPLNMQPLSNKFGVAITNW